MSYYQERDPYYDVPYSQMEPMHETRQKNAAGASANHR